MGESKRAKVNGTFNTLPNEVAAVGNCQKSIIAKAITSLVDTDVPFDQPTITNSSA